MLMFNREYLITKAKELGFSVHEESLIVYLYYKGQGIECLMQPLINFSCLDDEDDIMGNYPEDYEVSEKDIKDQTDTMLLYFMKRVDENRGM